MLINFQCSENFYDIISFNISDINELTSEFSFFKENFIFNKNDIYFSAMSYIYAIFSKLISENPSYPVDLPDSLLKAQKYIENNYTNSSLTNEMIAKHINVSSVYFRKLFHEYYNISPKKYIMGIRIRQAKKLLSNQLMSAAQVAESTGFSSVYNFSRAFKNVVGVSPNEYRHQCRYPISCCGKIL